MRVDLVRLYQRFYITIIIVIFEKKNKYFFQIYFPKTTF